MAGLTAIRDHIPVLRGLVLALGLSVSGAQAQNADCDSLRAALSAPAQQDSGAAAAGAAARKLREQLDRMSANAHQIGCDNQQFLFFGSPPPPQCGGIKARIAGMQNQYAALAARADGGATQRRAWLDRYNETCRPLGGADPSAPPVEASSSRGGSQAVCVRSCDGGFFPLSLSARAGSTEQLTELCQALCPNAEVHLFTRNPSSDISTAMAPDGEAYEDLPNALKYSKKFDPACGCKPAGKSWAEALAHADEVLADMGGAKSSDKTVNEQQSQALSQPAPAKPGKAGKPDATPAPTAPAPVAETPPPKPARGGADSNAPDGSPRPVRVVGPQL